MKKHIPLIIGLSLPVLFILIISAVIYLPVLSIKPQHNFLYVMQDKYARYDQVSMYKYDVENGKIVTKPNTKKFPEQVLLNEPPKLYLYDINTSTSHEVSFADAQKFSIDPGPSSPDGYTVEYKYGHDGVFELFGSNNGSNGYYISKGNGSKKLKGISNFDGYWGYDEEFQIIGWIK
ncbi:MAG: hypothetical protein RLY49_67 [Candidatus Parcubacteria bacterium]|jgi:hypothetical protein